MGLNIPGPNIFGREKIFKNSPEDDQVLESQGTRNIPTDQTINTDTIAGFFDVSAIDAAEDSTASTSFVTIKSITFTPEVANNQPLKMVFTAQIKTSILGKQAFIKITGDLGATDGTEFTGQTNWNDVELIFDNLPGGMITPYVLNVQMKAEVAEGNTAFCRNAKFVITSIDNITATDPSGKYGVWS